MRSVLTTVFVVLCCSPHLKDLHESQLKVKQLERVVRTLKSKQYVIIVSLRGGAIVLVGDISVRHTSDLSDCH